MAVLEVVPAKYASFLRGVLRDALLQIKQGKVPEFAIDEQKKGDVTVLLMERLRRVSGGSHGCVEPERPALRSATEPPAPGEA